MVVVDRTEDGDPFKMKPRCTITCLLSQGHLSLPPMAPCLPEPGLGANPRGTHGSVFARARVETPPDERTETILLPFCPYLGRSIKVPEPFDDDVSIPALV